LSVSDTYDDSSSSKKIKICILHSMIDFDHPTDLPINIKSMMNHICRIAMTSLTNKFWWMGQGWDFRNGEANPPDWTIVNPWKRQPDEHPHQPNPSGISDIDGLKSDFFIDINQSPIHIHQQLFYHLI
jgi:hypothetical protein